MINPGGDMSKIFFAIIILISCFLQTTLAQTNSQWRGENRDGKYSSKNLLKKWPENGPELITIVKDIGIGYSSPAVTNDRIYVSGMIDETGYLFAFDLKGKQLWKKSYGEERDDSYPGSRGTPTVVSNKIYLISGLGNVVCFNSDGHIVWKIDMQKQFNAPMKTFGFAESPLIDGDYLFCTPGSKNVSVAVLNRYNGKVLKTINVNGQKSAYCSPCIIDHNGKRIFTTMLEQSVIGIDLKSFKPIFQHPFGDGGTTHPNTPLYHKGYLYLTSGYDAGSVLLKLSKDGNRLTQIWKDRKLDIEMEGTVLVNGYLFGSGMKKRRWHCVDFMTGEIKYLSNKPGRKGSIIFADNLLYTYSTRGIVGLVKPNNKKFEVVSSFEIENGSGEHFSHPVIRKDRLYIRHGDELNIYNIGGI